MTSNDIVQTRIEAREVSVELPFPSTTTMSGGVACKGVLNPYEGTKLPGVLSPEWV